MPFGSGGGGGGPAAGTYLPVGGQLGVTLDTTTYDNPVSGVGKLATIVTASDDAFLAVAVAGDAHPRYLFTSSAHDGIYMGNGTIEPYSTTRANLSSITTANRGEVLGVGPLQINGRVTVNSGVGAPTIGGSVGDLFFRQDGGALTTVYRCTVAGGAGAATWTGIL